MRIISERGKVQLIFTSHNYIRFTNVKILNNLRDFYYRDIILGEQSEPVYEPTNNRKIAYAFLKAGDVDAT